MSGQPGAVSPVQLLPDLQFRRLIRSLRLPVLRRTESRPLRPLVGSFILGASVLPFLWNVFRTLKYGEITTADDPWGYGNSLEWATSSPPPRHNFTHYPGSTPNGPPSNCTTPK